MHVIRDVTQASFNSTATAFIHDKLDMQDFIIERYFQRNVHVDGIYTSGVVVDSNHTL